MNRDSRRRDLHRRDANAAAPLANGRYHLLEVIGEGGMATVYRGFDVRLQVPRAVKVLAPNLAGRRALRDRFEAEARTMALFDHPNIVRVVDVGMDGERVYIVMELVAGGSLLERVRDFGPLPARLAVDVMIEALRALQAAHGHGVVHRDIKPHNILLTDKGQVRVTDFGIARLMEGDDIDDALTRTGAVMGTWGFMAPEQKENAKAVDARADLYSAGATLWAIVTNQTPGHLFAADLDTSMMQGVPDALANFIKRSTRYKREDRFSDAAEMLQAAIQMRDELPAPPEDTPPLGARAPARPLPPPPDSTVAGGVAPLRAARGTTMVPDVTPVPDGQPPEGRGEGAGSEGTPGRWSLLSAATATSESSSSDADIGVDDPSWQGGFDTAGAAARAEADRRMFWTFVLLGLLAVLVAVAVGLALPRTLEEHGEVPLPKVATPLAGPEPSKPEIGEVPVLEPGAASAALASDPAGASASGEGSAVVEAPASASRPGGGSGSGGGQARASQATKGAQASQSPARSPTLAHSPVSSAKQGQQVDIKARLLGGADYGEVLLNYRALGSTVWNNQRMYAQNDALVASLVITGPLASGFEYFILARSDNPDLPSLSSGSFRSPYRVVVQ